MPPLPLPRRGLILRLPPGIKVGLPRLLPGVRAARLVPLVLEGGAARLVPRVAAAVGLAVVEIGAGAVARAVDAAAMAGIVIGQRRGGDHGGGQRGDANECAHFGCPYNQAPNRSRHRTFFQGTTRRGQGLTSSPAPRRSCARSR